MWLITIFLFFPFYLVVVSLTMTCLMFLYKVLIICWGVLLDIFSNRRIQVGLYDTWTREVDWVRLANWDKCSGCDKINIYNRYAILFICIALIRILYGGFIEILFRLNHLILNEINHIMKVSFYKEFSYNNDISVKFFKLDIATFFIIGSTRDRIARYDIRTNMNIESIYFYTDNVYNVNIDFYLTRINLLQHRGDSINRMITYTTNNLELPHSK